jgi:hypothetical protein
LEFRTRLLIKRLVALTGETEHDAVHRAVDERYRRLTEPVSASERRRQLLDLLESRVWNQLDEGEAGRVPSPDEEDAALGYGPEGV